MIVVVGIPAWRAADPPAPAGRACDVAVSAAARGVAVELVGRAGDDPAGDALMLGLTSAGVGHVAVLRDPARGTPVIAPAVPDDAEPSVAADAVPTEPLPALADAPQLEPADVALGLQYLTEFSVIVVTDDTPPGVLPVALEAAAFTGAHLVLLLAPGAVAPDGLPETSTVLGAPDADPDGAFADVVGAYVAALDRGAAPADAFAAALGAGWEHPVPDRTTN
jgi:sugar/nucleoside kinase (ribokinase family)